MEKTGRNESCPCGSGKKYKNCCLETQQTSRLAELDGERQRRDFVKAQRSFLDRIFDFVEKK